MSLANAGYLPVLTWSNPLLVRLEHQALVPMFGEVPVELGGAGREAEILERLRKEPLYEAGFAAAFAHRLGCRGADVDDVVQRALVALVSDRDGKAAQ